MKNIDKLIELGDFLKRNKDNIKGIDYSEFDNKLWFFIRFVDSSKENFGEMYYSNTYCEFILNEE
jgi:hypothetical protein